MKESFLQDFGGEQKTLSKKTLRNTICRVIFVCLRNFWLRTALSIKSEVCWAVCSVKIVCVIKTRFKRIWRFFFGWMDMEISISAWVQKLLCTKKKYVFVCVSVWLIMMLGRLRSDYASTAKSNKVHNHEDCWLW